MKIDSSRLIQTDQWIDRYGVVLSTISNLANLVMKIGIVAGRCLCSKKLQAVLDASPRKHYWEYIENKGWMSCLLAMLPGMGNWLTMDFEELNEALARVTIEWLVEKGLPLLTKKDSNSLRAYFLKSNACFFDTSILWETEAYALFTMNNNLTHFDSVAIGRLYRHDFLVKALQQYGDTLKQTPRYQSLKAQAPDYVKECERLAEDVELELDDSNFSIHHPFENSCYVNNELVD